jgi:hypothetical protein
MGEQRKKFKDWYDRELVEEIASRFSPLTVHYSFD